MKMKAKEFFEITMNMEDLNEEEFLSLMWSNDVENDFIGTMIALIEIVEENE